MAQNKYSNDVFFEPWVGQEYYSGIKVDDNGNFEKGPHKEKGQEPEKGFYRVMALGKEHYCKDENKDKAKERNDAQNDYIKELKTLLPNNKGIIKLALESKIAFLEEQLKISPCQINNNNNTNCTKLFICKQFTKHVIQDALDFAQNNKEGWPEPTSHKNFRQALLGKGSKVEDWNYLLFSNFFQRSMPNTTNNTQLSIEREEGSKAFVEIIKINIPNIIFVWGPPTKPIWQGIEKNEKILNDNGIFIRLMNKTGNRIPRIEIEGQELTTPFTFTILDFKNTKGKIYHSCLVALMHHPGQCLPSETSNYMKIIFKYHNEFIKWDNNATFYNGKPITEPPVCEIKWDETSKSFNWTNQSDFPK